MSVPSKIHTIPLVSSTRRIKFEGREEKYKVTVMAIILAGACLLTYYFHVILGTGTVFTHLFYIPIILASFWWGKKGLVVAIFLALFLIYSHIYLRLGVETANDYFRAIAFIAVGFVVATLSERIEKAKAIKLAYAELDQIFNTVANGLRLIDKDFNVLRVNETFLTLSGISRDEAMSKKCHEVFHSYLCYTPGCPLTQILGGEGGEERVECEVEKERNDGTRVPGILTANPFREPDGKLIGIVEDFMDISELKHAEQSLRKAHDELELRVKERTAELEEANELLKREIRKRKEAVKRVKNLELPALHRLFKPGKCYLIIEEKPDTSLKLFKKLLEYEFKGLLITRIHPSHVREEYNMKDVPIIWLTHAKGENHVVPTNIAQLNIAVKDFAENGVEGVIMLEGLEYLIDQNGFEFVLRFVESQTDILSTSECRLIMPFDALAVNEVELHRLERGVNVMNAKEVEVLVLD